MRTYTKNHRRTDLRVESLEGKALLSAGSAMHQVAPHLTAAQIVTQATAAFSGTLTGPYSNVHVPYAGYILSYATSGTLTGVGSTRLNGTLFVRPGGRAHRLVGQLVIRNDDGSMIVNVFQSAAPGTYAYKVARARGSDTAFNGGSGELMIAQAPTYSAPYYVSGQATMTFTPG
ncbi:MAG TPA: hypothetical protein VKA15_12330 [Isosphaeraceae bacterium]|nr:hypothetical protein [Isosphaeraceae bacterium]